MKVIEFKNLDVIVEPTRKAFNDFMNYETVDTQLKWREVHEEFFRLELGAEPKNKVLRAFILSMINE
jgi:hypothetical protein